MKLHLGEFGPVRVFGRSLIIICSYRGGAKQRAWFGRGLSSVRYVKSVLSLATLASLRRHVAAFRDHYANPRLLDAQLRMVRALLDQSRAEHITAIFDARLSLDESRRLLIGAQETQTADLASGVPITRDFDTIVLVYPDALGLTFGALERRLLAAGASNVVVLTGRRRLFPLSSRARRSFRWRRWLASTRIVELMAAMAVIPAAALLAGFDRVKAVPRPRS